MKKIIATLISSSVLLSGLPMVSFAEDNASVQTVEYIIRYNSDELLSNGNASGSDTDTSAIEKALENRLTCATDIQIIDEIESEEGQTTKLFSINTANGDELSSELNSIDGIYYAEPNYKIKSLDTDVGLSQQWAINGTNTYGIEAGKAWELSQGQDVLVAVIDTGIDISHRDLGQNIYTNYNETVNGLDSDNNGYKDDLHGWDFTTYQNAVNNGDNSVYDNADTDKHGTHIAGIIAAASNNYDGKGVAPQAKILPVKILSDNDGTVFAAIKGIEYAEMMGAKIANCSWGSEHYSQFLYDTIAKSDMLFVCAAGNDGYDVEKTPTYPAAYDLDNIISVAATDNQGQLASFSNYGKTVDVAAPGKDIYSTLPNNEFGSLDGTSMAAPFVSGCAALLLGVSENITAKEIKDRVLLTVNKQTSLNGKVATSGIASAYKIMMTTVNPENFTVGISGQRIVEANNEIYSVGGYDGSNHIGKIDKFDPVNKVWQTISNMPVAVSDCAIGIYDNKIFVVGGISENPVDNVQIYDFSTNTWSNGISMPEQICGCAYAQKGSSLYIFGGTGITGIRNCVYKYNMETGSWEQKADLPCKMTYSTAVLSADSIFLIGGSGENEVLNRVYLYDDADDLFEYVSHMQVGRKNCTAAAKGNKIYIFGGSISLNKHGRNVLYEINKSKGAYIEAVTDTVEVFDTATGICSEAEPLQNAVRDHVALSYFDNIYIFGGWDGECLNTAEKYFGAAIPKNIRIKTTGNKLNIKWNSISDADKYKIEIDSAIYETTENSYQISVSDDVEHKIRIKALQDNKQSMWSDYIFHYSNSTLIDAKNISVNSQTNDKLYETGQTRWYKLDNSQAGNLTVTLGDIPQNCNYIVQLCSISGEVIATGSAEDNIQKIENIVLSPYPYYIKVTSVYGGNENNAYTLDCSFESSSEADVPERVRSAFLKPSALDNLSMEMKPMSEYDGDEMPIKTNDETITKLIPTETGGGHGTNAYVEEDVTDESDSDTEISLMSLKNYSEETGALSATGKTAEGSITVSRNTAAGSQKCKVVIEVIPDNAYDEMKIEWIGSNTDYENFWWHSVEDGVNRIYYLTALLPSNASGTFRYKITCDYLAYASSGNYTVKKYIICDSYQNEDYDNGYCGNEVPLYASNADPSSNSSISKTGKIDHPYDRDYYYVTASENEKVTAYLKSPEGKKYDVSIYDNRCTTNYLYTSEYMDGWFSEDTANATIKGKSSSTVKYCIRVGSNDGSYSCDETYTLYVYKYNISKLGDLEVNNSFENADELKTNVLSYLGSETKEAKQIKFSIDSPVDTD
ncbi:MAG: S8 family serine peptidase, partial [Clostridiales bacterium]|nr:S8 family serine peptidase [Clostridiales bacterium]